MWYTRPDGSKGDSLTDIGALACIGIIHRAHVRACQRPDGSFFRHPDMPDSGFSRDHIVSLCFYSMWSGDREPLRKFLVYCLKNWGKFSSGSIGQSMLNPIVLAAMLAILGYKRLAWCLNVFNFPVLLLEAKFTRLGYRAILVSEVALIALLTSGDNSWRLIFDILHKREPANLWYAVLAGKASAEDAEHYRENFPKERLGGVWHWNSAEQGRAATGVDLEFLPELARRLSCEFLSYSPLRR